MLIEKQILFKILEDPGIKQLLHCTRSTGCGGNWPVARWISPVVLASLENRFNNCFPPFIRNLP